MNRFIRRPFTRAVLFFGLAMVCCLLSHVPAYAAEQKNVVFVLDASGSMWGQIKGTAKIEIAKKVMKDLIQAIPKEFNTGLMAYGHRRKGDCRDIEMLVPLGPHDPRAMIEKVMALKPKGKTPLSASVQKAAKALRHTEQKATVVLVSDGLETCDMDPCALARELAMSGVDFKVHVVGFGLSKGDQERLRCLADQTGGLFLAANDADSLLKALKATVKKVEEPSPPVVENPGTAELKAPASISIASSFKVKWKGPDSRGDFITIAPKGSKDQTHGNYAYTERGNPAQLVAPSEKGDYELRYVHGHSSNVIGRTGIKVTPLTARVKAPASANVATLFDVTWQGPDYEPDYICISLPDQKPGSYKQYTYTRDGSPLKLRAPSEPGTYEVRYILGRGDKLLAKTSIEIKGVTAKVEAPASANVATLFPVTWEGPANDADYICISLPDQKPGSYKQYTYTRDGSPLKLRAPSEPGTYEVRYILGRGDKLLAKTSIEIKGVTAKVEAPASANVASKFSVTWEGPGNDADYICISLPDQKPGAYKQYTYTRDGSPLKLRAPSEPGTYEVRYILGRGDKLLAKAKIEVKGVTASVKAPASANVATLIPVTWEGPGNDADYICISLPDQKPGSYKQYTYTRDGSPLKLRAPSEPGTYEVRYILGRGDKLLAKTKIEIKGVTASVKAPASVKAGGKIKVSWQGPGYESDYICVSEPDQGEGSYKEYTNTREGNPLEVRAPADPGKYEVRYIMSQGSKVLAKTGITVEPVTASIKVPASVKAGGKIKVSWQGPGYESDYICVSEPDQGEGSYKEYTNTREGNPLEVRAPADPGKYEVRYIMSQGSKVLAKTGITVEPVTASLKVPASVKAGGKIKVSWQGPGYGSDYICVSEPDQGPGGYVKYTNTREGNPLEVRAPSKPGDYEVRYIMSQGDKVLAKEPIKVD
ncbi:vWA domain-containing protein [Dethiosulfatarculus sandiegensis]|nr:VWA domain-containing protein [Dethiosulfatarculus sandiegensis]